MVPESSFQTKWRVSINKKINFLELVVASDQHKM